MIHAWLATLFAGAAAIACAFIFRGVEEIGACPAPRIDLCPHCWRLFCVVLAWCALCLLAIAAPLLVAWLAGRWA